MRWSDDPRIPFAIAALLGMIAGLAAKQAVAISAGDLPKPIGFLADVLILGIVFLIVMYIHKTFPAIPVEGIALAAASLAMWGPRGIAILVGAMRSKAAAQLGLNITEPTSKATMEETAEQPKHLNENQAALVSAPRMLRDKIPLKEDLPPAMVEEIRKLDISDSDKNIGGNND